MPVAKLTARDIGCAPSNRFSSHACDMASFTFSSRGSFALSQLRRSTDPSA